MAILHHHHLPKPSLVGSYVGQYLSALWQSLELQVAAK
jgi:hypothetical protein